MPQNQQDKAKVQPSGYTGENPSTAGPGSTKVSSNTPENRAGQLDPSAPNHSTNESNQSEGPAKQNSQAMGTVGYGGLNKPMAPPDGTAADVDKDKRA